MRALAIRPQLWFAFLFAAVVGAECMALASRGMIAHPQLIRGAVLFDLSVVPAGLWWLLVVRRGLARPRTIARIAVLSIAVAALLLGTEVRLLAVPLEVALVWIAVSSIRKAIRARGASDAATALRDALTDALGDSGVARAVASEIAVFWYAVFSWGRSAPQGGFTAYKRAGWVAISCAIALVCAVEAVPLHFLVHRWGPLAAAINAALHVYTLLWILGDLRALMLRRIRVHGGRLELRIGLRWEADIALAQIASISRTPVAGLRLGVLGTPNLVLKLRSPHDLHGPFGIRKSTDTLLLQVDEPDALAAAIAA